MTEELNQNALLEEEEKEEEVSPPKTWWSETKRIGGGAIKQTGKDIVEDTTNFVKDEYKLWKSFPGIGQQGKGPHPAASRLWHYISHGFRPGAKNINNTMYLGGVKAHGNALRQLNSYAGGDVETDAAISEWVDNAYRQDDFKPPSEMTEKELFGDDIRATFVLNAVSTMITGQGVGLVGTALPKFGAFADPTKAKNFWDLTRKVLAVNAIDEVFSTGLDDNTDGLKLFGSPTDNRATSALKAFVPNLGLASTLGIGANTPGVIKGVAEEVIDFASDTAKSNLQDIFPSIQRAKRSAGELFNRKTIQEKQVQDGILQPSELGEHKFAVEAKTPPRDAPDSVSIERAIEGTGSDKDIDEIVERVEAGENVPAVVEEVLARPGSGVNQLLKQEDVSASMGSLAQSDTLYSNQLGQVPTDNLLSLANPSNSPKLANKIKEATGKNFDQFDRLDVIKGIKAIEVEEGVTVMPNRLLGGQYLKTDDIFVDPARFQYKRRVNKTTGVQPGGSLDGVDKWNMDLEGAVQVWTDPKTGKNFVVQGHNRVDAAKRLGIPSVNVEYLSSPNAGGAKAQGALSNIALGSGTEFDAADFLRASGITDSSQLEALGLPLKSGFAVKGFALSKLPKNIYDDALSGVLSKGRAISLGGSGLDETAMQAAYKALKGKDITDATFTEVIAQAKNAPTIEGSQKDLFGNTDMLNLMVEKGKLAAAIRRNIVQNKNLFKTVRQNADVIEGAGSVIDRGAAQEIKANAENLLPQFDSLKYTEGPVSELLNEGARELSDGAKVAPVARRIQELIINELDTSSLGRQVDDVVAETSIEKTLNRKQKINQIIATGAKNGEIKPPAAAEIKVPKTEQVSFDQMAKEMSEGNLKGEFKKAMNNELDLGEQFEKLDDSLKAVEVEAQRTEMGWDGMTFEEKKANGLIPDEVIQDPKKAQKLIDQMYEGSRTLNAVPRIGTEIPRGEAAQTGAVFIERVDKTAKELIGEQKGIVDKTMARLVLRNEELPKTYDLAVLELQELNATQLAELGIKKADIKDLTARKTINLLKKNFDNVRKDLLPGEYRMEGYSESRRKLYKKWFKDDSDVSWVDRETSKASTISDKNSIPYLVVKEQTFDEWVKNPPDKYKQLFEDIEKTFKSSDELIARQKEIFDSIYGDLDEMDTLLKEGSQYDQLSPIDQKKVDLEVGMKTTSRKIQPGTPHPTDANKVRGYDSRWVTKKHFDEVTESKKGADEIRKQFPQASAFPPDVDFTDGMYPGDDAMRNYYRRVQEREAVREADYLAEWGAKIADSDMGRLAQSQQLAGEAVEAVRGAAITSGLMPAKIKWIDEVDMTKLFGEEEHIGAMRNWSPQAATFMARNPGDPLNKTAAGLTTGVYVSQTFEKPIRGSIALALHPSIDQRYGGALRKLPSIGRRFYTLAEHEAFHGVQEFLYLSGDKKLRAALKTPQAIAEMKEIIRKSRGNTMENMDVMEIQAEAFGNWANNRNLKLKDGGLKASFEKIKKFLNGVRARVRKILRKDPTYIDIFEMAHSGELARKKLLNTLSPAQLDAYAKRIDRQSHEMLPELTERINDYLTAKKVEYDTLINGWELDAASGGCL